MELTQDNATPGSVITEMQIDIYANPETNEVSVLHDLDFKKQIEKLILDPDIRLLYFVYKDGEQQDFGTQLKEELNSIIKLVTEVAIFKIDMKTAEPVAAFKVPLELLDLHS